MTKKILRVTTGLAWHGMFLCMSLCAATIFSVSVFSQSIPGALPMLTKAEVPHYPAPARITGMHGTVRMRIETGGTSVQKIVVLNDGGQPLLAVAAQENVRTWEFQKHDHANFEVTFRYLLTPGQDGRMLNAVLRLPVYVEVIAPPWPRGEPDRGQSLGPPSK